MQVLRIYTLAQCIVLEEGVCGERRGKKVLGKETGRVGKN